MAGTFYQEYGFPLSHRFGRTFLATWKEGKACLALPSQQTRGQKNYSGRRKNFKKANFCAKNASLKCIFASYRADILRLDERSVFNTKWPQIFLGLKVAEAFKEYSCISLTRKTYWSQNPNIQSLQNFENKPVATVSAAKS